jgi:hypothetical protein
MNIGREFAEYLTACYGERPPQQAQEVEQAFLSGIATAVCACCENARRQQRVIHAVRERLIELGCFDGWEDGWPGQESREGR